MDVMYERSVTVGIGPISREDVMAVARHDAQVVITDEAWAEVRKSREIIEALADDQSPHYGVSTGFGALATRHIPIELRAQLQRSLVRSHAAGSGTEVEREVVRALMLLRISTLATGRTGIRDETLRSYVAMLNAGLTPVNINYVWGLNDAQAQTWMHPYFWVTGMILLMPVICFLPVHFVFARLMPQARA